MLDQPQGQDRRGPGRGRQRYLLALAGRVEQSLKLITDAGLIREVHTRLAILDLSDAAKQPMVDAVSGCVLVYNGEIYNFRELRAELLRDPALQFISSGDTEVVLRGYLRWGMSVVRMLRGMFAFAIYDPRVRQLVLAREHGFACRALETPEPRA